MLTSSGNGLHRADGRHAGASSGNARNRQGERNTNWQNDGGDHALQTTAGRMTGDRQRPTTGRTASVTHNEWNNRSWDCSTGATTTATTGSAIATATGSAYHVGTYYSPYRHYSYRPVRRGAPTSARCIYGSSYWITNPWQYRLPDV